MCPLAIAHEAPYMSRSKVPTRVNLQLTTLLIWRSRLLWVLLSFWFYTLWQNCFKKEVSKPGQGWTAHFQIESNINSNHKHHLLVPSWRWPCHRECWWARQTLFHRPKLPTQMVLLIYKLWHYTRIESVVLYLVGKLHRQHGRCLIYTRQVY